MKIHAADEVHRDGVGNGAKDGATGYRPTEAAPVNEGEGGDGLGAFVRSCTRLPGRFRSALKESPGAVVATTAAGSFVLGALLASRLGRVLAVATIYYGVNRLLDGPVGRQIGSVVHGVSGPAEG